jgi:hypothetical protein
MSTFATRIRPYVQAELDAAAAAERSGSRQQAFRHLERAHVLAQPATTEHVRVHWHMFRFALTYGLFGEAIGQTLRLVLAGPLTVVGAIPMGNTGGSEVSGFLPMPVPADLQKLIDVARAGST